MATRYARLRSSPDAYSRAEKTKLVEFGRFAQRHAGKRGRNRPETLYCTRNQRGNFKVGMRTENLG